MLGMLHKTNTITGASHLGAKPFIHLSLPVQAGRVRLHNKTTN